MNVLFQKRLCHLPVVCPPSLPRSYAFSLFLKFNADFSDGILRDDKKKMVAVFSMTPDVSENHYLVNPFASFQTK